MNSLVNVTLNLTHYNIPMHVKVDQIGQYWFYIKLYISLSVLLRKINGPIMWHRPHEPLTFRLKGKTKVPCLLAKGMSQSISFCWHFLSEPLKLIDVIFQFYPQAGDHFVTSRQYNLKYTLKEHQLVMCH